MSVWPAKDPQSVQDYEYTIPLDTGDSVSSYTFSKLAGDVVIDSESRAGADVTVWLSGGTDGETAVFRIAWATVGGRDDDDVITLFVSSHEYEALVLTDYAKPLPPHLKLRYPAFASIEAGTIQYWLTDAERYVTTAWTEGDYAAGLMALAAHNMALAGYGTEATAVAAIPIGVSRFKSGTLDVTLTEAATNARASGDLSSTRYGIEFGPCLPATAAARWLRPPASRRTAWAWKCGPDGPARRPARRGVRGHLRCRLSRRAALSPGGLERRRARRRR
jgi:hypothetical protein